MRTLLLAAAALPAAVALLGTAAVPDHAATVTAMFAGPTTSNMRRIDISEIILPPDAAKLEAELKKIPAGQRLMITLNSGGGELEQSFLMADMIHARDVIAVVGPGSECSGSCFALFAAAKVKVAEPTSSLSIFTVQERSRGPGEDLPNTLDEITRLKDFGVPEPILWRLLRTPYGTWHNLTAAERATLGVDPIPADDAAPAPPPSAQNIPRNIPGTPPAPVAAADPGQSRGAASTLAVIAATVLLGWLLRKAPAARSRRTASKRRASRLHAAERAVARGASKRPLQLRARS